MPTTRSWFKTAIAFLPFLTLVISAWLYAIHLDTLANQSMYNAKVQSRQQQVQEQKQQQESQASSQDNVVIGDSKDNIFYFVQVKAFRKNRTKKNEAIFDVKLEN